MYLKLTSPIYSRWYCEYDLLVKFYKQLDRQHMQKACRRHDYITDNMLLHVHVITYKYYSYSPLEVWQLIVWDATCPDTFAPSYFTIAAKQGGACAVAQQAEEKKMNTAGDLQSCHFFPPVAIETTGPRATKFLKELGAGVWRSHWQLLCIPHSETLSCRPTW